jgi:hypothetical protein
MSRTYYTYELEKYATNVTLDGVSVQSLHPLEARDGAAGYVLLPALIPGDDPLTDHNKRVGKMQVDGQTLSKIYYGNVVVTL